MCLLFLFFWHVNTKGGGRFELKTSASLSVAPANWTTSWGHVLINYISKIGFLVVDTTLCLLHDFFYLLMNESSTTQSCLFFFLTCLHKRGRGIRISDLCFIKRSLNWLSYLLETPHNHACQSFLYNNFLTNWSDIL
jgi:hypothetical protein